jgi:probable F420-dependent oxidoreductase
MPLPFATPEDAIRLSVAAERLGYHSVWGNDHITPPQYVREMYDRPPNWYEILITLSFVAAATKTIKLGTAVLVVPMREPVFLSKQIATLDHYSKGRLLLGVGVGAYREEFEALKPDQKNSDRGKMLTEGLIAMRKLFSETTASYHGEYVHFENIQMFPKPLQDPFPIYVGGNHVNAMRRAAQYGNGWLGASLPPDKIAEGVEKIAQFAEEYGRDPSEIEIAPQVMVCIAPTHEEAIRRFESSVMYHHLHTLRGATLRGQDMDRLVESNLIGSPEEIIERTAAFQKAGVTLFSTMSFISPTIDATLEDIEYFAAEVMPAFRS